MRRRVCAAALGCWLAAGAANAAHAAKQPKPQARASDHVGVVSRVFHPKETRDWRGDQQKDLRCVIWYPAVDTAAEVQQRIWPGLLRDSTSPDSPSPVSSAAASLFDAGMASPNAAFTPSLDKFPLVLLSHPAGGSALQMAWLGTALARAGYIAVAVDHPGNNSDAAMTPEGMALWWERATDLSDVLTGMLADPTFSPHIDASRVVAAGFSLGGYAVLELAGARTDISVFFDRCKATPDSAICNIPQMRGMGSPEEILHKVRESSAISLAASGGSYRDPRVKAVFAIAPALGFTLTRDSLRAIRLPVEIVVGADDRIASPEDNANWIRENVHGAREETLPGVGHYTFLDDCTALGEQVLARYCEDAEGVDRAAVHAQVAGMAIAFFDHALRLRSWDEVSPHDR